MNVLAGTLTVAAFCASPVVSTVFHLSAHKLLNLLNSHLWESVSTHCPEVDKQVKALDLEHKVHVMELFIQCIEAHHYNTCTNEAVQGLHAVVETIHDQLSKIAQAANKHKLKYFASWRTLDYTIDNEFLPTQHAIMMNRFRLLRDVWMLTRGSNQLVASSSIINSNGAATIKTLAAPPSAGATVSNVPDADTTI